MVEAATMFRKNGFNDSDAATLAKTATMFQNVSDEAISAGDSASFIISQMIAFGIEAKDAQSVIDKVNETANKFSVSSGDLSKALGIVASTSSAMGNSIDQTLGVVTAITEQTRNASKSARAANTIFSRLAQVVDENSDTGAKLTEIYDNLGIALYDSSGQMRSTYDILADLASKWDSLDKNTQQYIAITSAGTNQLNNFLALMNNFDHAAEATATSLNSAGSAMRENEAFQESLEYQTNNLKAEFQDLANNVIDKELISSVLKLGDAFLKLANTDIGVLVTKIGLLAGAGWGLSSLIQVSKIIPTIVGQFQNFGAVLSLVAEGSGTFGAALSAAGGAGAVALPIFLAVSAAIVGIVEAVKAYKESHPDFDTAAQSVSTLSDSLKTAQDRLDEINQLGWKDRTRAINEEEQELKDLIAQQERELQVAQMRQAMAAGEELSERTGYGQATRYTAISPNDTDNQTFASMDEAVKSLAETEGITGESTDGLKQKLLDLGYAFVTTTENTKLTADEMNALDTQALQELSGSIKENGELNTYLKDSYQGLYEELAPTYEKLVNLENAQKNAIPGARELTDSERELKGAFEQLVGTMLSFESSGDNAYQTIANLANLLSVTPAYARDLAISMGLIDANTRPAAGALVQLENGAWAVADGLNAAKDATNGVDEAMNNVSVATYDTSTATAQLTASLFDQNGQLTEAGLQALSVDSSMRSLATSELQAQQAAAQANYANLIIEIQKVGSAAMITAGQLSQMMALAGVGSAQGLVGGLASGSNTDIEGLKSAFFRSFGKSADSNVADFNKWVSSRVSSAGQSTYDKIMEETQKRLDELEKNFPSGGGGGGGSSRKSAEEKAAEEAEKQAKKAQKAQEKAAKESQQAYESAAKSAEQAAQEAARAAEQAAEEAKQKILDSIQELKDVSDDFWDSKTDAIEETNKELDRQKQLEEKLKALEEAKQKKILLYKNGQFQYDKDYGTIAKAQADYEETRDKIQRERELEQLKEMKDNATEIFNEMKDIISNGGDVTQTMINNWLSQMQADGANYYDSNKVILSDWLTWAQGAIKEFSQSALESFGNMMTVGGSSPSGQYGNIAGAQTNGQRYLSDPFYYDENGDFVGYSVAMWMDIFEAQLKNAANNFKPLEWLGGQPGTNVFDDWAEVLDYWGTRRSDITGQPTEPAGMEDMLQRLQAAQKVLEKYRDVFESLGYEDYLKVIDKTLGVDRDELYKQARMAGATAHPEDPFGWRNISPADWTTTAGKLYDILQDITTYEYYTGSQSAANPEQRGTDYTKMTIAGDLYRTAAIGNYHKSSEKKFTDAWGDYFPGVNDIAFDPDKLERFRESNEEVIKWLSKVAYFDAQTDEERAFIHQEAEARRQARDYAEEILYGEASGKSEAERAENRQAGGTVEARRQEKKNSKNIESIEDTLQRVSEGQAISDEYINSARDYIVNALKENREISDKLYSDTEKAKIDAQTSQMKDILDQLNEIQKYEETTTSLLEGEETPWAEDEMLTGEKDTDWLRDEEFDKEVETKRAQMLANAESWWKTTDDAERKRLHEENVKLAEQIGGLTYTGSTGKWSHNANGTHNFRGGLSIVGENGPELRVLKRGDNIIPADKTENLWKWAGLTPNSMLAAIGNRSAKAVDVSYGFNISNLQLPNVTDAKSLVQGLKNYALQYSYKR